MDVFMWMQLQKGILEFILFNKKIPHWLKHAYHIICAKVIYSLIKHKLIVKKYFWSICAVSVKLSYFFIN